MKTVQKSVIALALSALVATLAPAAAMAQTIGFALSQQDDTFLTILRDATMAEAKKKGATLQVEDAQGDVGKQLSQIQNLIAQKVDAIIVNIVDTDVSPRITKLVNKAGIPLVYVNRKPVDADTLPEGVAFVASDEKVSGTVQTQEVCRLLKGKGNILVLSGDLSNEAARTRTQDIDDVIKTPECAGMKVLDKREGKWSRTEAQNITTNWLSSGTSFDAIISNNDEMALGAINALKSARKWKPDTLVAGIDATPDALASMKAGDLKVTVFQNAAGQGSGALDAALRLIRKEKVDRFIDIPFELVTPANLKDYLNRN